MSEHNGSKLLTVAAEHVLEARLLDRVYEQLAAGAVEQGMQDLFLGLRALRLASKEAAWVEVVRACLAHPVRELVYEDPFTRRAFIKPRGYAGDAELLDFVYGREERWPIPLGTSEVGQRIFEFTTHAPASQGVRARRGFIADLLDRLAEELYQPHVMSVGAGHLREASIAASVRRRKLARFVALDSDWESLNEVRRCYGDYGVEIVHATVRQLLTNRLTLGSFDLVYATGLFDYLRQSMAHWLAWRMFELLRPRGLLLVANFLPGIRDIGYMESYMDWKLFFRTRQDVLDITAKIPQADIRDIRIFAEENQNIIFLQVRKS